MYVLVVDDESWNRDILKEILTRQGIENIIEAKNSQEVFEAVKKYTFDLIFMDILLPGKSGLEIVRQLRAEPKTAKVPVIAMTAEAMKGDKEKILKAGCNEYISKPLDLWDFIEVLKKYVKK